MSKVVTNEPKVVTNDSRLLTNLETNQTYLGPIIIHSQNINMIRAIEEYFEARCIARIMSDSQNFYIDFKPMVKSDKLRDFVSPGFVLRHNGEVVQFTHQFYDL
jgi:hypothetical protein